MPENIKITREQVFFLVFIGVLGNIVYSHTWIDDQTDRAAWVAALAGILLVIPFAVWILYLGKNRQEETIFDILEAGLGKVPCAAINVIYILINIAVAVAMLNMFSELLKAFFYAYTPDWVSMLVLILLAMLFSNGGFKAFARTTEILSVIGLVNYFVSFIPAFPRYIHLEYIFPIFDCSWLGFIKGTIFMAGAAGECLLLLMVIVSYIPDSEKHYLWVVKTLAFAAVVFSSAILVIAAMMSPQLAKSIAFGGVNAAKLIEVREYLHGLELFIYITYQFIAIGKITICLYCSWIASKRMLNNWKPRLQLFLIALMIFVPSVWLNSYIKAYELAVLLGSYIILPFTACVLLLGTYCTTMRNKNTGSIEK